MGGLLETHSSIVQLFEIFVVMYCCLLYVLSDNLVENNVSSFLASAGKDLCCFTKQVQCLCVFTDFWETPAAASCLPLSLGGPCLDWV